MPLHINVEGCEVFFPKHTAAMLGFIEDHIYTSSSCGVSAIDMERGTSIYYIFIYCDLIEERIDSSTLAPLLHVIKVPSEFGQMHSIRFTDLNYLG